MDKIFIKTGDPALVGIFKNFDHMLVLRNKQAKTMAELQLSLVHHKYCVPEDSMVEGKVEINEKRIKVLRQIFRVMRDDTFGSRPYNAARAGFIGSVQPDETIKAMCIRRHRIEGPDADGVYQFHFTDLKAGDPSQPVRMTLPEMRAVINYAVPRMVTRDRYYAPWDESTTIHNWEMEPIDDNQNESAGSQQ